MAKSKLKGKSNRNRLPLLLALLFLSVVGLIFVLSKVAYNGRIYLNHNQTVYRIPLPEIGYHPTPTPTYIIDVPKTLPIPTPTLKDASKFLNELGMTIDYNTFEVDLRNNFSNNNKNQPVVNIKFKNNPTYNYLVSITDLSALETEDFQKYIDSFIEMNKTRPTVRDILIEDKQYSFKADEFGEALPESENSECASGGGYISNSLVLNEKILIRIRDPYSLRSCNREPFIKKFILTPSQKELLLRLIETIDLQ